MIQTKKNSRPRPRPVGGLPGRPRTIIPNGTRFGRGIVQWFFMRERLDGKTDTAYELLCDCGNPYITTGSSLRRGHTKSCGCLNNEKRAINWKKRDEETLNANRDIKTGQYRPATDPQRQTTPPPRDLTTGKFTQQQA